MTKNGGEVCVFFHISCVFLFALSVFFSSLSG